MLDSSAAGRLGAVAIAALALGALATFLRLLPSSTTLVASIVTFVLVVVAVGAGVVLGSRDRPDETAYW
jgi:hypothetical protein